MKRIGIFGGTFNPVHHGHLIVAEDIRERFGLTAVYFVPSFTPPHKTTEELIPAEQRLELVKQAIKGNIFFKACPIEIKRSGISFSIDTIRYFLQQYQQEVEIFFLLGSDAFAEIATWHEVEELFNLCRFLVLSRPTEDLLPLKNKLDFLRSPPRITTAYIDDATKQFRDTEIKTNTVILVKTTLIDISSSQIRARAKQQHSLKYLVPSAVEQEILSQRLYQTKEQA